jgi:hypothetical protein
MAASKPVIFLFQLVGKSQALGYRRGGGSSKGASCLSKQLLQLLKQNSAHVADGDSVVVRYARAALLEQENCLYSSSFDYLLTAAMDNSKCRYGLPNRVCKGSEIFLEE